MDTTEVRVESDFPKPKHRLYFALRRLVMLVILITVLMPLMMRSRLWPPELWSDAAQARYPLLGWALDIGPRVIFFVSACFFYVPFSFYVFWLYLIGLTRTARWFQLTPAGLEVGYTRGTREDFALSDIECVCVQSIPQVTKPTLTVTTRAGMKIKLRFVAGPDAVDEFCTQCVRKGVRVIREQCSVWRTLVPFLAVGPALILLVVAMRYALKW